MNQENLMIIGDGALAGFVYYEYVGPMLFKTKTKNVKDKIGAVIAGGVSAGLIYNYTSADAATAVGVTAGVMALPDAAAAVAEAVVPAM